MLDIPYLSLDLTIFLLGFSLSEFVWCSSMNMSFEGVIQERCPFSCVLVNSWSLESSTT